MTLREFEQNLAKVITDSKLSIDAVYYVMKNLMQEVEQQYYMYCKIEDEKDKEENNEE